MFALALATIGFLSVLGGWVAYMANVPRGTIPVVPVRHMMAMGAGMLLAAYGLFASTAESAGVLIASAILAGFSVMMGGLFFYLLTQRKTPLGELQVKVGDQLLAFKAMDSDGRPFDSASLRGRRVLLKFFRGHW